MKKSFFALSLFVFVNLHSNSAFSASATKRTDGPPGSEYSEFSDFDGQFSLGVQFGALIPVGHSSDTSFAIGADLDYRPSDLFGFKLNFEQGLQTPRSTVVSMNPLVHTEFSNLVPYLMAGPGIVVVYPSRGSTTTKFLIDVGIGADVAFFGSWGFGMLWDYNFVFAATDWTSITARISYRF